MGNSAAWPDEDIEVLKRDWLLKNAGEIGESLGRTRNSVIGQAHRLGLPKKDATGGPRKGTERPKRKRIRNRTKKVLPPPPPPQEPVSIMEIELSQCRAVIDGKKDELGLAMMCGKPVVWGQGFLFCSEHLAQYTTRGYYNVYGHRNNQQIQADTPKSAAPEERGAGQGDKPSP